MLEVFTLYRYLFIHICMYKDICKDKFDTKLFSDNTSYIYFRLIFHLLSKSFLKELFLNIFTTKASFVS